MKKQRNSPISRFLIRTLVLALWITGALFVIGGVLLLCENPLAYAGVGAVCALLLVGFFWGLFSSREEGFLPTILSPLCLSLVMLIVGLIITRGHLSLSPLINHLLFLISVALGTAMPKQRKRRRR